MCTVIQIQGRLFGNSKLPKFEKFQIPVLLVTRQDWFNLTHFWSRKLILCNFGAYSCWLAASTFIVQYGSWIETVLLFNFRISECASIYVVKIPWNHIFACFFSNHAFIWNMLLFTTLRQSQKLIEISPNYESNKNSDDKFVYILISSVTLFPGIKKVFFVWKSRKS